MASYTTNLNLVKPTINDPFNVEDANSNMQKVDDAYGKISDVTIPISPDVAAALGLTGNPQVKDALLRIAPIISNPNLLDNGDLRNPVNTHGQSSYVGIGGTYSVDRWVLGVSGSSLTMAGSAVGSVTLAKNYGQLLQYIGNCTSFKNCIMTATVRVSSYSGNDMVLILNDGISQNAVAITSTGYFSTTMTVASNPTHLFVALQNNSTTADETITPEAFKLELGSVSTLANDPPASYGEQLARCMGAPASIGGSGGLAAIAAGSYVGTGTYGSSNKNSLTFPFIPKLVVIQQSDNSICTIFTNPSPYGLCLHPNVVSWENMTWNGNSVSWYSSESYASAGSQLNNSGATYYYVAIG